LQNKEQLIKDKIDYEGEFKKKFDSFNSLSKKYDHLSIEFENKESTILKLKEKNEFKEKQLKEIEECLNEREVVISNLQEEKKNLLYQIKNSNINLEKSESKMSQVR
jgi:hypothetical protein